MAIVPTENYGLMTGLASGVNSFLNTYTTMKNIQHQNQMQEMTAGVTHDENGNLKYTDAKQTELDFAAKKAKHGMGLLDASTPESQSFNTQVSNITGAEVPQSAAGADTQSLLPLYGSKMKADATTKAASNRFEHTDTNFDKRIKNKDETAARNSWEKSFGANSPIVQRVEGAERIEKLMDAADRGEFKTNQAFLGQLNAEVSRLETGSKTPGLHAQEKTELESSAASLRALADKITNNVSGADLSKQIKQTRGMVGDLKRSYLDWADNQAESLKAGASDYQTPIYEKKHGFWTKTHRGGLIGKDQPPPKSQADEMAELAALRAKAGQK